MNVKKGPALLVGPYWSAAHQRGVEMILESLRAMSLKSGMLG